MVKHTQTIRQQNPTNCLSEFDHFVGGEGGREGGRGEIFMISFLKVKALWIDTEFQRDVSNVIILTCHGKESFNLWLKSPKKILSLRLVLLKCLKY